MAARPSLGCGEPCNRAKHAASFSRRRSVTAAWLLKKLPSSWCDAPPTSLPPDGFTVAWFTAWERPGPSVGSKPSGGNGPSGASRREAARARWRHRAVAAAWRRASSMMRLRPSLLVVADARRLRVGNVLNGHFH